MNCKKYRACLVGVIAVALVCGMLIYMKYGRESQTPVDATLVQNYEENTDGIKAWA